MSRARISEGQTAVFAYPSVHSGCKSIAAFFLVQGFVSDCSENEGGARAISEYYFSICLDGMDTEGTDTA